MDTKQFEAEFDKLLAQDAEQAIRLITGMFVGVLLEYMRRRGFDAEKQILIEGTETQRAITIHAMEEVNTPSKAGQSVHKRSRLMVEKTNINYVTYKNGELSILYNYQFRVTQKIVRGMNIRQAVAALRKLADDLEHNSTELT